MPVLTFPATHLARLWGASLTGLPSSVGWWTVDWPWEKTKINGEKCPLTHFFAIVYMNRTVAPWTLLKMAGWFSTCLKYWRGIHPTKTLIRLQSLPAVPVLSLTQGLQCAGRRSKRGWLYCFSTEGIFPREQLFGLVHWALLQTKLLEASNPEYFKRWVTLP